MLKKSYIKILIGIVAVIVLIVLFHLAGSSLGMIKSHLGL